LTLAELKQGVHGVSIDALAKFNPDTRIHDSDNIAFQPEMFIFTIARNTKMNAYRFASDDTRYRPSRAASGWLDKQHAARAKILNRTQP
jgi:hypothetical protein